MQLLIALLASALRVRVEVYRPDSEQPRLVAVYPQSTPPADAGGAAAHTVALLQRVGGAILPLLHLPHDESEWSDWFAGGIWFDWSDLTHWSDWSNLIDFIWFFGLIDLSDMVWSDLIDLTHWSDRFDQFCLIWFDWLNWLIWNGWSDMIDLIDWTWSVYKWLNWSDYSYIIIQINPFTDANVQLFNRITIYDEF